MYIFANWKMHKTLHESVDFVFQLMENEADLVNMNIALFPNLVSLAFIAEILTDESPVKLGAQNIHAAKDGPYTGETSITQVEEYVSYILVGHSERRQQFHETDEEVNQKLKAVFSQSEIRPVLCIGETEEIFATKTTKDFLEQQVTSALKDISQKDLSRLIIAYETIWAISGTDGLKKTLEANDIEVIAQHIKDIIKKLYNSEIAANVPILYGGSVSSKNVQSFLSLPSIDGVLVGSQSLEVEIFRNIIKQAQETK